MGADKDTVQSKGNVYNYFPEDLHVETEPGQPFYSARALRPPTPELVASIRQVGQVKPITIKTRPGQSPVVVAGRKRHAAIALINSTLAKSERMTVACVHARKGVDPELIHAAENTGHEAETTADKAEHAARLSIAGRTNKEIAIALGCSTTSVDNYLTIAEAPPAKQQEIAEGKTTARQVIKEQKGKSKPKTAKAPKVRDQLTIKQIRIFAEVFTPTEGDQSDANCDLVLATVNFILGDDKTGKGLREYGEYVVKLVGKFRRQIKAEE